MTVAAPRYLALIGSRGSPPERLAACILLPFLAGAVLHAFLEIIRQQYLRLGFPRSASIVYAETIAAALPLGLLLAGSFAVGLAAAQRILGALRSRPARWGVTVLGLTLGAFVAGRVLRDLLRSSLFVNLERIVGPVPAALVLAVMLAMPLILFFRFRGLPMSLAGALGIVLIAGLSWSCARGYLLWSDRRSGPDPPNILLVSLDTLRADRVGCYGYRRPTTPGLDGMAAEGALFESAITAAPWTLPSHASILTGLYPHHHGAVHPRAVLAPEVLSIAERLREAGYWTAAVTGGGHLSDRFGFSQGFDDYVTTNHESTKATVAMALERLSKAPRPFFLFLHTYEPHMPYEDAAFTRPSDAGSIGESFDRDDLARLREGDWLPSEAERRYVSDLYDGDARATDEALVALWSRLRDDGELDRTFVVVTSDHGEEIFDRGVRDGVRHGHTLYEELVRVPLILRFPPLIPSGARIEEPVSLVDLAPTMASIAGLEPAVATDGIDLMAFVRGSRTTARAGVLSEAIGTGPQLRSLRTAHHKLILPVQPSGGRAELYDLLDDPMESRNLFAQEPETVRPLLRALLSFDPLGEGAPAGGIDPELEEQLRALGYIQ